MTEDTEELNLTAVSILEYLKRNALAIETSIFETNISNHSDWIKSRLDLPVKTVIVLTPKGFIKSPIKKAVDEIKKVFSYSYAYGKITPLYFSGRKKPVSLSLYLYSFTYGRLFLFLTNDSSQFEYIKENIETATLLIGEVQPKASKNVMNMQDEHVKHLGIGA